MSTITEKKAKSSISEKLNQPYRIILHNDDYNTFDWVITCLMSVCEHDYEQANQCALIVHYKGKCDVKYGDFEKLSILKVKLENAGLSVVIEKT